MPGQKIRFKSGDKGIHLSCPETYFTKFDRRKVFIQCGDDSRFNVYSYESQQIDGTYENKDFGCGKYIYIYKIINGIFSFLHILWQALAPLRL